MRYPEGFLLCCCLSFVTLLALLPLNTGMTLLVPQGCFEVDETAPFGARVGADSSGVVVEDATNRTIGLRVLNGTAFRFELSESVCGANGVRAPAYLAVNTTALVLGEHVLTVQAFDLDDPSHAGPTTSVTVCVMDMNDPPMFQGLEGLNGLTYTNLELDTLFVPEHTSIGTELACILFFDRDEYQQLSFSVNNPSVTSSSRTVRGLIRAVTLSLASPLSPGVPQTVVVCARDDGMLLNVGQAPQYKYSVPLQSCKQFTMESTADSLMPAITALEVQDEVVGLSTRGNEAMTVSFDGWCASGGNFVFGLQYDNGNVTFAAAGCHRDQPGIVVCLSAAGYGASFRSRLLCRDDQTIRWSSWFVAKLVQYALPAISGLYPNVLQPTNGGNLVSITGNHFGTRNAGALNAVSFGPTGFEYKALDCVVLQDHVLISCRIPPAAGKGLMWTVEIGHQMSILPRLSFEPPVLYSLHCPGGCNASTAGGDVFELHGANFGTIQENPIDRVIYGPLPTSSSVTLASAISTWYAAANCRVTVDHVEIRCYTVEGAGVGHHFLVTIRGQDSHTSTFAFDYAPPAIDSIELVSPSLGSPTKGDVRITVDGSNFGSKAADRKVSFGTRFPSVATMVYVSHNRLQFTLPAGNGVGKDVQVTVSEQMSNKVKFNFDKPVITSMKHVNGSAGEDIIVSIQGNSFGYCCYTVRMRQAADTSCDCVTGSTEVVTIDGEVCKLTTFVSDSEYQCKTRATSGNVVFTVAGLRSFPFSYAFKNFLNSPFISTAKCGAAEDCIGPNAPTTAGGTIVTVIGGSFATQGIVYFLNGVSLKKLPTIGVYNDKQLQFRTPPGQGVIKIQVAVMGESQVSANFSLEYRTPVVQTIGPLTGPTSGGTLLTILGTDFGVNRTTGPANIGIDVLDSNRAVGSEAYTNAVYIDGRVCVIRTYTHTLIRCASPPGAGTFKTIEVRVGRAVIESALSSTAAMPSLIAGGPPTWSYLPPIVDNVEPNHGPTLGGTTVKLTGSSLGGTYGVFSLTVGGISVNDIVSRTHTEIVFKIRQGISTHLPIAVHIDGQTNAVKPVFSYDPPEVYSVVAVADRDAGRLPPCWGKDVCMNTTFDALASTLVLTGKNFGPSLPDSKITTIKVGYDECFPPPGTPGVWVSDSVLSCTLLNVPVGPKKVWVNISEQATTVMPDTLWPLRAECRKGYYGSTSGEYCQKCPPIGALCTGSDAEPIALQGYWKFNRTVFEPCQPMSACMGGITQDCDYGYQGTTCSSCAQLYYRDTATRRCLQCPQPAYALILVYVVAVGSIGLVLYKILQARPSLASLSIVLDYMQVFSTFGSIDLPWPSSLQSMFVIASAGNLDIDFASPECSVAASYTQKWFFMQLLPIIGGLSLVSIAAAMSLFRKMSGQKGPLLKHWWRIASAYLLVLNLLYLPLLKKSLQVFDCKSIGGQPFLVVDRSVPCFGSEYELIRLVAYSNLAIYGFGIPTVLLVLLVMNREPIRVSHAAKQRGLADARRHNPFVEVHRLLGFLYLKFKPSACYWPVVIMTRKALIAVAVMTFDRLQTAVVLAAVLHLSLLAHALVLPYWSSSETESTRHSAHQFRSFSDWLRVRIQGYFAFHPNSLESSCMNTCLALLALQCFQVQFVDTEAGWVPHEVNPSLYVLDMAGLL